MVDTFSKKKRSQIMSSIRSKDTQIEIEFRKTLWNAGYRYRKNAKKYFGKPDLVLKKHKAVVFIDSCFWHGCPYHLRMPKTNIKYWKAKIERNKERDEIVSRQYKKLGWKVVRFWEHQIKKNETKILLKIKKALKHETT